MIDCTGTMQHKLDEYGVIRCINFIRDTVASGGDPRPSLAEGTAAFEDFRFMHPVMADDALLSHDFAAPSLPGCVASPRTQSSMCELAVWLLTSVAQSLCREAGGDAVGCQRLQQLEAENAALIDALQHLRLQVCFRTVVCVIMMRTEDCTAL